MIYSLSPHLSEAKLRSIYYFVGDRPVHKLPFGPKCYELFVISYSMHANLSDDMFLLKIYIYIYYTLRFYFPYLSLLAQPVNILV
jgi:hypothetical protein